MKKILLFIMLLPAVSFGQDMSTNTMAGMELKRFYLSYSAGIGCEFVGVGVAAYGANKLSQKDSHGRDINPNAANTIYFGGSLFVVGIAMQIISHHHVYKAGKYLSGQGLTFPINGKRKRHI